MSVEKYNEEQLDLINNVYRGSDTRYKEALQESIQHALRWKDVARNATVLSELKNDALNLIEQLLGYMPHESVYMENEVFLRALIAQYKRGEIQKEQFEKESESIVKQIRNEDMRLGGWINKLEFDESDYKAYDHYLSLYKTQARERIENLLSYSPELKYSLQAEMVMRQFFQHDFHWDNVWYHFDFKCVTMIKYREILLTEGRERANEMELIKFKS